MVLKGSPAGQWAESPVPAQSEAPGAGAPAPAGPARVKLTVIVIPRPGRLRPRRVGPAGAPSAWSAGQSSGCCEVLRAEAFAPHLPADSQDHFDPGLGVLVNLAAASARGELLAFVDEELAPTPDWVEAVERLFASAATDAVVGTTLLRPANAFAAAETGLEGAGGLALCIRRQAFMAAGGLDEYLCPQASAGAALVAALAARGVDVRASGEIVAYRPACRGVWEFARRLWLSGVGLYYGPRRLEVEGAGDRAWRRRALPRRIAAALAAPWRAAGIARGRRRWRCWESRREPPARCGDVCEAVGAASVVRPRCWQSPRGCWLRRSFPPRCLSSQ